MRLLRVGATLGGAAAIAAALYLWLFWLPAADPSVIVWPEGLALLVAPVLTAAGIRDAPSGGRLAVFAACLLLSVVLVLAGAVALFIAGSR